MASRERLGSHVKGAACALCKYLHCSNRCQSLSPDIAGFAKNNPIAAQTLVAHFNSSYRGVNWILHRAMVSGNTKVRVALEDSQDCMGCVRLRGKWFRRHLIVLAFFAFLLLLPMLLSPTHPIAVYSYLAAHYAPWPFGYASKGSTTEDELHTFLTSDAQIKQYRIDLKEDVRASNTGKLFVIVRRHDGNLEQRPVRTWNELLPETLPFDASSQLDRKEIPFLGDVVEAFLESDRIEATGHYHSFGGPPSDGDRLAGRIIKLPEIVVANGLFPMVYLRGVLLSYGEDVSARHEVFAEVSKLDASLQAGGIVQESFPAETSAATKSFLSYLRNRRGINVDSLDEIRDEIGKLCGEFESDYRDVFTKDIDDYRQESPDIFQFLHNIRVLSQWAEFTKYMEGLKRLHVSDDV